MNILAVVAICSNSFDATKSTAEAAFFPELFTRRCACNLLTSVLYTNCCSPLVNCKRTVFSTLGGSAWVTSRLIRRNTNGLSNGRTRVASAWKSSLSASEKICYGCIFEFSPYFLHIKRVPKRFLYTAVHCVHTFYFTLWTLTEGIMNMRMANSSPRWFCSTQWFIIVHEIWWLQVAFFFALGGWRRTWMGVPVSSNLLLNFSLASRR